MDRPAAPSLPSAHGEGGSVCSRGHEKDVRETTSNTDVSNGSFQVSFLHTLICVYGICLISNFVSNFDIHMLVYNYQHISIYSYQCT